MEYREEEHNRPKLAERYTALLETARVLTSTRSTEGLYRAIYRETARVLEATGFYIARYDAPRDLATVVFYADRGYQRLAAVTYRGSDSSVIRTGKPALVHDQVQQQSVMTLGEDTGVTRSAISAPVLIKSRVAGVISAQSYRPEAFVEEDLELLQAIADIAAVALENAEHLDELHRRRQEAERIEEIGRSIAGSLDAPRVIQQVINAALDLLGADRSSVWLLEERLARTAASGGRLALPEGIEWELGDGLSDILIERKVETLVHDIRASDLIPPDVRLHLQDGALLLTPLVVEGEVTGFLAASNLKANRYGAADLNLLKRLGAQASVALENARLHARLQALSMTDPLTGLPNRRHLRMHLTKEIAAAVRGRKLAVVLFDVDGFKQLNDTRGHVEGDHALQAIASILNEHGRAMNLVARFGGDEFISILSDSTAQGAKLYADRVCGAVQKHPDLAKYGVSLSYGVALYSASGDTNPDHLIKAADEALYAAKAARPTAETR